MCPKIVLKTGRSARNCAKNSISLTSEKKLFIIKPLGLPFAKKTNGGMLLPKILQEFGQRFVLFCADVKIWFLRFVCARLQDPLGAALHQR